jgi:hypothetical protein
MKNVKALSVNIRLKTLFKTWLQITEVFHGLTKQQIEVLALLLYHHYKLSQEITNKKILWKMVFDYEVKKSIKQELDIPDASLQNVLTKFRKKGIIIDNQITSNYIPNIEKDSNTFKIVFNFNIIHDKS